LAATSAKSAAQFRPLDLSAYLREWLAAAPKKYGSLKLDIDPQSFL
jgi:primosomal protein N' (replication factor Y)